MKYLTITGADSDTNIEQMAALSVAYPFLEWGILYGGGHLSSNRFPGHEWRDQLAQDPDFQTMNISAHLCGQSVRNYLRGKLDLQLLPDLLFRKADRIQINTHGEPHVSKNWFWDTFNEYTIGPEPEIIFQLDGVNNHYLILGEAVGIKCTGLFDLSHGAGVLQDGWPSTSTWRGYAGGLGPDNLEEELRKISKVATNKYWIDMETNVRTRGVLDLNKVRQVCEIAQPFHKP